MRRSLAGSVLVGALLTSTVAYADDFAAGSLVIPMDTTYQDDGMLKAFGLVYDLLRHDVPIRWVIRPGKAHLGVDFTASAVDHHTGAVVTAYGYRGGPWVIDAADAAKAMPFIDAWQAAHPEVAVHQSTAPFQANVARYLVVAPTIAMHQDGNEGIARSYLQAAGIPDSTLNLNWPTTSPDMLTPAEVAGPTTTNHHDGKLFDADGDPTYCQFMSMHWAVTEAAASPETVVEVREFLTHPVHFFAECQAVNAFEGAPPTGGRGNFLTTQGFTWPAPSQPKAWDFSHDDSPFAQIDGAFKSVGGSEPAYSLPPGGVYSAGGVVMITKSGTPEGDSDVWMSGFLDGACPPQTENCNNNYGKVSYLGGHQYSTALPISKNPTTQGTRLFLNSLFEAPCATLGGQPQISFVKAAPSTTASPTVTFTIDYQNTGAGVALAASISDQLPSGSSFVSASSGSSVSGNTISWNLGNLGSFESGQVSLTVTLGGFGTYTNTAHLNYKIGLNSFSAASNTTSTLYDVDTDGDGIIDAIDICPTNYNPAQNLQTDIQSCGSCGTVCAVANGTPVCGAGQCGVLSCQIGFSDCDGLYATGCEYANSGFPTDVANCGGCRKVCAPQHANGQCSAGSCGIGSCTTGFSNCNGLSADGCEYNDTWFSTDASNCNGCGIACSSGYVCKTSSCTVSTCAAGQADCDNFPGNGCEVNTNTDAANCGGCGLACTPAHGTGSCAAGKCGIGSCAAGFSDCDGLPGNGCEYDNTGFATDPNNCGSCGALCAPAHAGGLCVVGVCKLVACAPGFSDCDGLPANGCEYDNAGFPSDPQHCGGCGTACTTAHATALCTAGSCKMGTCNADYVDVDGKEANGCECHKVGTTDGTCDGIDDDCNGLVDDGYVPIACGTGACASKSRCVNGAFVDCAPGRPSLEGPAGDPTCADSVDNDCDGLTDDVDPNCTTGDGGVPPGDGATNVDASSNDGGTTVDGATGRDGATTSDVTGEMGGNSSGGAGGSAGSTTGGATGGSAGASAGGSAGASAGGSAGSKSDSTGGDQGGGCGCRVGKHAGSASWPSGALLVGLGLAWARAARRQRRGAYSPLDRSAVRPIPAP